MTGSSSRPALVTLHVWRMPRAALPRVLWRVALDRRRLRRTPGVAFAKLVGTGRDLKFGAADADLARWAAIIAWDDPAAADRFDDSPVGQAWLASATARCRVTLRAISSRGRWARQAPFEPVSDTPAGASAVAAPPANATPPATAPAAQRSAGGPVLVVTRARLRARQALAFWRTIASAAGELPGAPGLLLAFGFSEAPVGWQGTISVWRDTADLVRFAYRRPGHRAAVTATRVRRWYAEELFARFEVLDVDGDRDVLGWQGLGGQERGDRG